MFSVNPEYSKLIFSGKKKVELRKTLPKIKNRFIAIYETSPTKKIVGLCEVLNYYELPIKKLNRFVKKAQINKQFLHAYYKDSSKFVAIEIAQAYSFRKPLRLKEFSYQDIAVPQSFSYINNINFSLILSYL
ncbi:ASCH domain-containing protein [archaeon AH-315-M20]|nr:ASCH domain-containing protein [archaeon AH-315-M20]